MLSSISGEDAPFLSSRPVLSWVEQELTDSALRFFFMTTDISKGGLAESVDDELLLTNRGYVSVAVLPSVGGMLAPKLQPSPRNSSEICWGLAMLTARGDLLE